MHRSSFGQVYQNGGRSPYAAYARDSAGRNVSDLYDYVDEQQNVLSPHDYRQAPQVFEEDDAPDVLHVRYQATIFKFEFPPFSIAEEKVRVHHIRDRVAQRLGMEAEKGRIKLMYKDKELKRNDAPLRKYGCKQNSEIVVIVTQDFRDYNRRDRSPSDSDSYASSAKRSHDEVRPHRSYSSVRPRDRDQGREPDRRDRDEDPPHSAFHSSNGYLHPHSTPPNGTTPPRQQSPMRPTQPARASSPTVTSAPRPTTPAVQRPTADPSTPLGKIQAISHEFHTEWYPMIEKFIKNPPSDRDDRIKEYRRLNEIAYKKVFEPGDLIEPDGPQKEEIRAARKQLYADAQRILKELDRFKPKE